MVDKLHFKLRVYVCSWLSPLFNYYLIHTNICIHSTCKNVHDFSHVHKCIRLLFVLACMKKTCTRACTYTHLFTPIPWWRYPDLTMYTVDANVCKWAPIKPSASQHTWEWCCEHQSRLSPMLMFIPRHVLILGQVNLGEDQGGFRCRIPLVFITRNPRLLGSYFVARTAAPPFSKVQMCSYIRGNCAIIHALNTSGTHGKRLEAVSSKLQAQ